MPRVQIGKMYIFSVPHIQNLYEDGLYRYHWVVSLSRYVDINDGEIPEAESFL